MPSPFMIRPGSPDDVDAITRVTEAAFRDTGMSSHTEHFIVLALRRAGALSLSLVAELEGRLVEHIAFSPVTLPDGTPGWYRLGPVSVLPAHQRTGIGSALIREGCHASARWGPQGAACRDGDPLSGSC